MAESEPHPQPEDLQSPEGKAALYGAGAAFVGFAIYALTASVLNAEVGLISILWA